MIYQLEIFLISLSKIQRNNAYVHPLNLLVPPLLIENAIS